MSRTTRVKSSWPSAAARPTTAISAGSSVSVDLERERARVAEAVGGAEARRRRRGPGAAGRCAAASRAPRRPRARPAWAGPRRRLSIQVDHAEDQQQYRLPEWDGEKRRRRRHHQRPVDGANVESRRLAGRRGPDGRRLPDHPGQHRVEQRARPLCALADALRERARGAASRPSEAIASSTARPRSPTAARRSRPSTRRDTSRRPAAPRGRPQPGGGQHEQRRPERAPQRDLEPEPAAEAKTKAPPARIAANTSAGGRAAPGRAATARHAIASQPATAASSDPLRAGEQQDERNGSRRATARGSNRRRVGSRR